MTVCRYYFCISTYYLKIYLCVNKYSAVCKTVGIIMENSSENIENLYRKENKLDEKLRLSSFIIFSIFQIAFASKFLLGESDTSLLLFIFGISILMILLVKIPSLRSLYISKEKINAEFDNLKDQVKKADTKIDEAKDKIEKLFLLTMSNPMYHNLEKLANPPFGEYFMESALKENCTI